MGVQSRAKNSELNSATVMVIARARKKLPVTPVTEISGRNTTMGVMVEPTSGIGHFAQTRCWMDCRRCSPASRCSTMFSRTTMASSITRPTAAASPPKVIKIEALAGNFQNDAGDQQRRGNHQASDQRRAPIAKKEHQDRGRKHKPSSTASRTLEMES